MSELRAKTLTTADGVYVNVNDFKRALDNQELLLECGAMIKVAKDAGHPPLFGVRMCILNALVEVTGEKASLTEKFVDEIAKEGKSRIIRP